MLRKIFLVVTIYCASVFAVSGGALAQYGLSGAGNPDPPDYHTLAPGHDSNSCGKCNPNTGESGEVIPLEEWLFEEYVAKPIGLETVWDLGTMPVDEGAEELARQLEDRTYDGPLSDFAYGLLDRLNPSADDQADTGSPQTANADSGSAADNQGASVDSGPLDDEKSDRLLEMVGASEGDQTEPSNGDSDTVRVNRDDEESLEQLDQMDRRLSELRRQNQRDAGDERNGAGLNPRNAGGIGPEKPSGDSARATRHAVLDRDLDRDGDHAEQDRSEQERNIDHDLRQSSLQHRRATQDAVRRMVANASRAAVHAHHRAQQVMHRPARRVEPRVYRR